MMRRSYRCAKQATALAAALMTIAGGVNLVWPAHANSPKPSAPYAGQEARPIKSLSPDDVAALRDGRGWGFALPAELSGFPGPLHVLELANELELSDAQRSKTEAIFNRMKSAAKRGGDAYLAAEAALDAAFASPDVTPNEIDRLTQAAGAARASLRAIHLNAHLETRPLLSAQQLHRYAKLRGYTRDGTPSPHGGHGGAHGGHGRRQH